MQWRSLDLRRSVQQRREDAAQRMNGQKQSCAEQRRRVAGNGHAMIGSGLAQQCHGEQKLRNEWTSDGADGVRPEKQRRSGARQ